MVIPVGLPDAQRLLLVEKDVNGKIRTKEIVEVLFSLLEGPDEPVLRACLFHIQRKLVSLTFIRDTDHS